MAFQSLRLGIYEVKRSLHHAIPELWYFINGVCAALALRACSASALRSHRCKGLWSWGFLTCYVKRSRSTPCCTQSTRRVLRMRTCGHTKRGVGTQRTSWPQQAPAMRGSQPPAAARLTRHGTLQRLLPMPAAARRKRATRPHRRSRSTCGPWLPAPPPGAPAEGPAKPQLPRRAPCDAGATVPYACTPVQHVVTFGAAALKRTRLHYKTLMHTVTSNNCTAGAHQDSMRKRSTN